MSSWVIYKASITRRANIPKMSEKLTGCVHGAVVSSPLAKSLETTAASPATLQLQRKECDTLRRPAPNTVVHVLLNFSEIEQVMLVW